MKLQHLRGFVAIALVALLAFGPGASALLARTKKGDKLYKEGQAAEVRRQWDQAAELYSQAVNEDPKDPAYLIGMRRSRFEGGQAHIEKARDLRTQGNMAEAIAEFQRAILLDPSSSIAMQELRRTQEMLAQPIVNPGQANLTPSEQAQKDATDRSASLMGLPELNPPIKKVGPIKANNQPINILYNTIAGLAGVTIVWDSTWTRPTRGFDLDLPEMSVEQAFEYLGLVTRTFWKPLTPTSIFVTEESANKRRDYTDNVVKTFFVTNAATAQEFNEIQTAVRTITDIRRVYPYVAQKAIVVRGDADAVALAEKLIRDLDKPKSEVVIDVIIMEVNTSHTRDLAASINQAGGALGLSQSLTFNPRAALTRVTGSGTTAGTTLPLSNLTRISSADFSVGNLGGAILQAIVSDTRTKILNNPQLRASDGQKARLEIGDRVPIATGSFQTGATGVGGVGVNTQFQFQPVGVIVDITPTVHSTGEVTLHVELEVSQVKDYVDVGNIRQPIIGQDKSTADLRLREGEVNILAGLTRQQDSTSGAGIPGLVNIPILGHVLFGNSHVENDRGDLMIALVPHIVRSPDYSPENMRGIFAGVDQQLRLMYSPKTDTLVRVPVQPAPAPGNAPGAGLAPGAAPAKPGVTGPPTGQPVNPLGPQAVAPQANLPPATPPAPLPDGPGARVTFMPGVVAVRANSPFTLNVQVENAANAFSVMPLRISWDPAVLRLNDIAPGELMQRDGGRVTSVKDIRNDAGLATLSISRAAGAPAVTGSGAVAVLNFVAIAAGSGRITVTELSLADTQNRGMTVTLGSVPVAVQ
ncbi:MAG: cohesin domain-containing protein [Acidobacteriota bacterium]